MFRQGKKIDLCVLNQERHFDACMEFINNQKVVRYMLVGNFPVTFPREESWFEHQGQDDKNIVFAIETKDGLYLGNGGLHRIDWINRHAEMGLFIGHEDQWGKDYGTEAERLIIDHGFNIGLSKIYANIFAKNKASLRVAEKNKAKKEGELKKHLFKNGEWHDLIMVAFFK